MSDRFEPSLPDLAGKANEAGELETAPSELAMHARALVEHMAAQKESSVLFNVIHQEHEYAVRVTLVDNVEEDPVPPDLPVVWPIGPPESKD